jgi:hypothetical protein
MENDHGSLSSDNEMRRSIREGKRREVEPITTE